MSRHFPSLISALLACSAFTNLGKGQALSERFAFDEHSLSGWTGGEGIASIDAQTGHAGTGSLTFRLGKKGTQIFRSFHLPAARDDRARLLRVTLFVKSRNLVPGNLSVSVLKTFDSPRAAEWFDALNPTFMTLPISPEWTQAVGEGLVGPEVRALNLYLNAAGDAADGQAWIDDIAVELLDRGILLQSGKEGNIYTSDLATMDVIVSAPEKVASGQVQLFDEEERVKGTVALKPGVPRAAIDLPDRGYYTIRAEIRYGDGTTCRATTTAAVVGPLIPDHRRMKSPFGLTGDGNLFLAAGARWDRRCMGFQFDYCKTAADKGFKKDLPAPMLEVAPDRTSIYCLWPQPVWLQDRKDAATGNPFDMYPMKDWTKFRQLVQWRVRNMSRRPMEYVEVANEPECGWKGSWKDFVKYHEVMAEGVKAASPTTKVLGPCLCTIKINELKDLEKLGLLKHLDGLSIHAYVRSTPPEAEFIRNVRDLKAYLVSIGRKDLPIFFTEYGWPLPPGDWQKPVDPLTQARYVSRSSILLVAEQIKAIQYFCMRWADPSSGAYGYGLLNWDFTPRPGYAAYANAARCLTGVTGPGRILSVTPTAYLALFRKDGGTLAAAWDVQGPSHVFVPGPWKSARGMMGGAVTEPAKSLVPISPSPVFIELADAGLYGMKQAKSVRIRQGKDVHLPWTPVWVPSPFTAKGPIIHIPADTTKGPYLAIGRTAAGWECAAITVIAPLEILGTELTWPVNQSDPQLEVKVAADLSQPVDLAVRVKLTGTPEFSSAAVRLTPKQTTELTIPLSKLEPGRRYRGTVTADGRKSDSLAFAQVSTQVTLAPCLPLGAAGWSGLPVMDFSAWNPFAASTVATTKTFATQDCSGTLQAGCDNEGLHLRVVVQDDVHRQTQGPKEMWMEDSVQIGLDLDADQPWKPNAGGCNGHFRIFEYGAALGVNGPLVWRWMSYRDDLPQDMTDARVKANIKRQGGSTIYDLTFPWVTLGLAKKPAPGSTIGFSLAVNDYDTPATGRKGLTLFGGIVDKKDPTEYGRLWVR